ncbi:MAG: TolC family protein, partial [Smithellaceae bacterium]
MTMKCRCLRVFTFAVFVLILPSALFAQPLTLEESIAIALKHSFVINIAKEGTRGAEAQKKEAMTGFLPKFSTSYSYTRLNEEPNFYFPGFPPLMPAGNMITGTINNYNWVVEARQPLFAGGGILANYEASKVAEDAARVEETAKTLDVVLDVKIAYFNILRMQRLTDTARRQVEMLGAHSEVADNFFRVGLIPKNDMLQAGVELANGKQTLVKAKNAVQLTKARLNTILKRDVLTPVEIVDILDYKPMRQSFDECLGIARQHRPELKLSALRVEQAGKMVSAAKSEFFPAVSLVGNYARFGDTASLSGTQYKDTESWQVMAVTSWNFWEWGKTKYRVDAGKARENQAMDQTRELNDQIALEIKNAFLVLQEAESQIAVSQKVIEQA